MFSSIYLKSLRDARLAILGWGLGMGLLMLTVLAVYPSLVTTPQAKASLVNLAGSFAWLAAPVRVDTAGGYATFKYGVTILLIAVWPILAGARMFRREEDRGSMDALLSLPRTRVRVGLEKLAAMWSALLGMGLLIAILTFAGGAAVNGGISAGQAVVFAFNIVLVCFLVGAIAMLISQFTETSGTAAGSTAAVMLVFVVLDMVHRIIPNTDWVSSLSPIYYYNLNKPLIPGQSVDAGALALLFGLSVVLSAAAIWLFTRRDIGAAVRAPAFLHLPQRPAAKPSRKTHWGAWSLRSVYTRSLATLASPTLWWTLAIAGFGGWMVIVVVQTEANLRALLNGSPTMQAFLRAGGSDASTNASILRGNPGQPLVGRRGGRPVGAGPVDAAAAPQRSAGPLCGTRHLDGANRSGNACGDRCDRGRHGPEAGSRQPGGGDAVDDPSGTSGRSDRLPPFGMAECGDRHRAPELPARDLVLHSVHRP